MMVYELCFRYNLHVSNDVFNCQNCAYGVYKPDLQYLREIDQRLEYIGEGDYLCSRSCISTNNYTDPVAPYCRDTNYSMWRGPQMEI